MQFPPNKDSVSVTEWVSVFPGAALAVIQLLSEFQDIKIRNNITASFISLYLSLSLSPSLSCYHFLSLLRYIYDPDLHVPNRIA